MTVCISGKESKFVNCGPVTGEPEEVFYSTAERGTTGIMWLVPASFYGIPGDSGSPIWDRYTGAAVGILSGGQRTDHSKHVIQPLLPWPQHEVDAPGALGAVQMAPMKILCWNAPC